MLICLFIWLTVCMITDTCAHIGDGLFLKPPGVYLDVIDCQGVVLTDLTPAYTNYLLQ